MDDYSQQMRDRLLAEFPEFAPYQRVQQPEQEGGFLVLEVPPPGRTDATPAECLMISTADREVTVAFDESHAHFNEYGYESEWAVESDATGVSSAILLIRQLLAEETCSVSWWNGEKWWGSRWLSAERRLMGALQLPGGERGKPDRVRIRSWRGRLNEDHAL